MLKLTINERPILHACVRHILELGIKGDSYVAGSAIKLKPHHLSLNKM